MTSIKRELEKRNRFEGRSLKKSRRTKSYGYGMDPMIVPLTTDNSSFAYTSTWQLASELSNDQLSILGCQSRPVVTKKRLTKKRGTKLGQKNSKSKLIGTNFSANMFGNFGSDVIRTFSVEYPCKKSTSDVMSMSTEDDIRSCCCEENLSL